jgi:uncharacterized membrane protein YcjF (UPF0283 family)
VPTRTTLRYLLATAGGLALLASTFPERRWMHDLYQDRTWLYDAVFLLRMVSTVVSVAILAETARRWKRRRTGRG